MVIAPAPTTGALDATLQILDLEPLEVNLFRGQSPQIGRKRVYGGQVLAQAFIAAVRTVPDDRFAHSLHCYFLLGGDPVHPIVFEVERTRDGGSFTTRRVKALQHGRCIFSMSASFQRAEDGCFEHQIEMPDVPGPDGLPNTVEIIEAAGDTATDKMKTFARRGHAIEVRPVDSDRLFLSGARSPQQAVWLRTGGALPGDRRIHEAMLAYASDVSLLDTALIAHGTHTLDTSLQLASLDHALWFHRAFRADDWLLYAQDSPFAGAARGFSRGSFFDREGRLVASAAQEGLVRKQRPDP